MFDTKEQIDYVLNLLDARRDKIGDQIRKLEETFTDHVALHQQKDYRRYVKERDLNATIVVKLFNEKRRLAKQEIVNAG
jgi:stress-induced morphogen